jgi:hypothetical protein
MQLVAGRVAQEFNQRKSAKGLSGRTAIMQRPLLPMVIFPDV